jgi:hypothetical protein
VIICAAGESCYTDLVLVEGDEMTEGVSSFCKSLDPRDPKSMVYRDNLFADVMEIFEWRCINPTSGVLSPPSSTAILTLINRNTRPQFNSSVLAFSHRMNVQNLNTFGSYSPPPLSFC